MSKTTKIFSGIGFFDLLGLLFITLKLTEVIDWSWWWVLAPLWAPIAIGLSILLAVFLVIGLVYLVIIIVGLFTK